MRIAFARAALIFIGSVLLGILINQFYARGIHWAFLMPITGDSSEGIEFITVDSAFQFLGDEATAFVDVRSAEAFEIDHLPGAFSLPWQQFLRSPRLAESLRNHQRYIVYCFEPDCYEAPALARELSHLGLTPVYVLFGGMSAWLEFGFPVEQ